MSRLVFKPMTEHPRGTIMALLDRSYRGVQNFDPWLHRLRAEWKSYDDEIYDNPDTVGAAGFVTYLRRNIVGFATWDPRPHPTAVIGHNCVLPDFRGRGFGKLQIEEVCKRLVKLKFSSVRVSTGDHPFFLPARRMYIACGFREVRRQPGFQDRDGGTIELERKLWPT